MISLKIAFTFSQVVLACQHFNESIGMRMYRIGTVPVITKQQFPLRQLFVCSLLLLQSALRSNLKGLYKGDIYSIYNSQKTICPSRSGVVCWMGLTGYQAAIISLGKDRFLPLHSH